MKKIYLKILKKLNPLLTETEAEFLLNIPEQIPEHGVILEIGSYKGGSAFLLAKGSMKNKKGKVYTIDPDINNLNILKENIKSVKMEDWIIPITKTSEQAAKNWKKPISLLFIDGNHDYPFVKMDFLLWEKYLVKSGIIAFHDSRDLEGSPSFINKSKRKPNRYIGPKKVARENILNSDRFESIGFIDSITYAKKIRGYGVLELLKDIFNLYWAKLVIKFDQKVGKIGISLKKHHPKLYFKLKKLKRSYDDHCSGECHRWKNSIYSAL